MARKRDFAAEYRARQAKARRLGYESYYGRRVRAGRPPSEAKPTGELLRRLRGHASAADLEELLRKGKVSVLTQEPIGERDDAGRYTEIRVTVQLNDGRVRRFRLRDAQLEERKIEQLRVAIDNAGIEPYQNPSLDILQLAVAA